MDASTSQVAPILLIDIGNTFLKWSFCEPPHAVEVKPGSSEVALAQSNTRAFGRVLLEEVPSVARTWRNHPVPSQVIISNVAGTAVVNLLLRALEAWESTPEPQWIYSKKEQCGISNGYLNPRALGCDRWAAMIAARAILGPRPALVVSCGTATTMDLLTGGGEFLGGGIMPGLGLMQRVLHQNTATLPDAQGEYVDYPRQTVDAIASGCAHAQAGAVERLYHLHQLEHEDLACIISGGAARTLMPRLTISATYQENLVLEGLYQIARETLFLRT